MPQTPTNSDTEYTLWKKILINFYEYAGATDPSQAPANNDSKYDLIKKVARVTGLL